ncbi:MAG: RNA-binding protein [Acetivibrionales bacterium]|nr:RNA-binding protein [Clostridiaceae bacterium]
MDTIIGRYVWSKAGRDKAHLFIIIDIVDDQHVMVADGRLRTVSNPKKKKLKHLNITNKAAEGIQRTISIKKKLLDADLQRAIEEYKED